MLPRYLRRFVLTNGIAISVALYLVLSLGLVNAAEHTPESGFVRSVINFACPGAIYEFDTSGQDRKLVALTIDDGPDRSGGNHTEEILEVLGNRATGTFFLISNNLDEANNKGTDPVVQEILARGHELGNHLTRDEGSILLGDRFADELDAADIRLKPYLGDKVPIWIRPGVGFCTAAMQQEITRIPVRQPAVLGSVWPLDTFPVSPNFVKNFVLNKVRPGSIIVLHDGGNRGERTAKVLEKVLPELSRKGYEVVSLSEMLNAGAKPILSATTAAHGLEFFQDWLRYVIPRGQVLLKQPVLRTWLSVVSVILVTGILYAITIMVMLVIGFSGSKPFLERKPTRRNFFSRLLIFIRILILPAFAEELLMRGLLLPGAAELQGEILANLANLTPVLCKQVLTSTVIYIVYHPLLFGPIIDILNRLRAVQKKKWSFTKTFWNPIFLVSTTLLGSSCALSYLISSSLLGPVIFHGIVVFFWLEFLGGESRLRL